MLLHHRAKLPQALTNAQNNGYRTNTATCVKRRPTASLATEHNNIQNFRRSNESTVSSILDRNEFRRGVGLCIVNNAGLVFAAKRMDDVQNTWQMPQGGIDHLENPLIAARRELFEETGMTSVRLLASIDTWLDYEFPTKVRAHNSLITATSTSTIEWIRYRGQTQKWLLLHFTGNDTEIDLHAHGHPEFSEWKWMPLEDLPASVVEFKKDVYRSVAQHFAPQIRSMVMHCQ